MPYYVYIMANRRSGTLYVGMTNNLIRRVNEHRESRGSGFVSRYRTQRLVHYEVTEEVLTAIEREKNIKKWYRDWKIELIEKHNPQWRDLYPEILGDEIEPK